MKKKASILQKLFFAVRVKMFFSKRVALVRVFVLFESSKKCSRPGKRSDRISEEECNALQWKSIRDHYTEFEKTECFCY